MRDSRRIHARFRGEIREHRLLASRTGRNASLEPRNIGKRQPAGMNVQAAELGAAVQLRENFSGIEQAFGVERTFDPLLLIEVDLREHYRHQVALLYADTVFAREHAADFDTQLEDLGAEFLGFLQLARNICVIENERMQIAVPGMKNIGDAQAV